MVQGDVIEMALARKLTADEYAELPESQRGAYIEKDGEHLLDVGDDPQVVTLQRSLASKKADATRLHEELKAERTFRESLTAAGITDPEEIKTAIEEHKKRQEGEMLDKGQVEELVTKRVTEQTKKMRDDHVAQVTDLESRNTVLETRLSTEVIDVKILEACVRHDVLPSAKPDVVERVRKVFRLDEQGEPGAFKPGTKEPLFGKDGERLTFDEHFEELKTEAPHLFKPSDGSGATNAQVGGVPPGGLRRSKMTPEQKVAYIGKHNREAYLNLPE
jgi:hypothetical protein